MGFYIEDFERHFIDKKLDEYLMVKARIAALTAAGAAHTEEGLLAVADKYYKWILQDLLK